MLGPVQSCKPLDIYGLNLLVLNPTLLDLGVVKNAMLNCSTQTVLAV